MKRYISILIFVLMISSVAASNPTRNYECVRAEIADMQPSSVQENEDFTIGVQIENCGESIPETITFEIVKIPTSIIVKDPLVTTITDLAYSNSDRFLNYNMRTTADAQPGTHTIRMELTYGSGERTILSEYEVNVYVTRDEAEPRIASVTTNPVHMYEGDPVELQIEVRNFGEGITKAAEMEVMHPFTGARKVTLGAFSVNETQTAHIKFKVDAAGEFEIPVSIVYEDDFGMHKREETLMLTVLPGKRELNIASVKTNPVLPKVGETVELTMRIENFADKTFNSVQVTANHPFDGVKNAFIGTLEGDEDGPAIFTFIPNHHGEFPFPVTVSYRDDFGVESLETELTIQVLPEEEKDSSGAIILLLVLVIVGLIYWNIRTKRVKEQVIQQLLRGSKSKK